MKNPKIDRIFIVRIDEDWGETTTLDSAWTSEEDAKKRLKAVTEEQRAKLRPEYRDMDFGGEWGISIEILPLCAEREKQDEERH